MKDFPIQLANQIFMSNFSNLIATLNYRARGCAAVQEVFEYEKNI